MRHNFPTLIITVLLLFIFLQENQGQHSEIQMDLSINKAGGIPDPSAIVDIRSQNQGILLPRMTALERTNINMPQTGLLVYDLDLQSLFYFDGSDWVEFGSSRKGIRDRDLDTSVKVEESPDEDLIRMKTGGVERIVLTKDFFHLKSPNNNTVIGDLAGGGQLNVNSNNNTVFGFRAGNETFDGTQNTIIGMEAGLNLGFSFPSHNNTLIGFESGKLLGKGASRNTILGSKAYNAQSIGTDNVIIGSNAGLVNNSNRSSGNIFIGSDAGHDHEDSEAIGTNIAIGFRAGKKLSFTDNILIGYEIGSGESIQSTTRSIFIGAQPYAQDYSDAFYDILWIDNDDHLSPLIQGDFSDDILNVNGKLGINRTNPSSELFIVHADLNTSAGLTLRNDANLNQWRLYTTSGTGSLRFYSTEGGAGANDYVAFVNDATGTWNTNSDVRVKKNITQEDAILDRVNKLKVVSYRYKRETEEGPNHIGLIAQDVEKVFPGIVNQDPEGDLYSLSYAELGPIAIKAVQELSAENKSLQLQINELKALYEKLVIKD